MRDYSIRYLDARGRTTPADFIAFQDDASAVAYAHLNVDFHAMVEVWRGRTLVKRLPVAPRQGIEAVERARQKDPETQPRIVIPMFGLRPA
jgi:hypothetical protein